MNWIAPTGPGRLFQHVGPVQFVATAPQHLHQGFSSLKAGDVQRIPWTVIREILVPPLQEVSHIGVASGARALQDVDLGIECLRLRILEASFAHDPPCLVAQAVLESGQIFAAEIVICVEHADLRVRLRLKDETCIGPSLRAKAGEDAPVDSPWSLIIWKYAASARVSPLYSENGPVTGVVERTRISVSLAPSS